MPIDANIISGLKPVQIESPVNALAKMLQVQSAQQENQLGQMKLEESRLGLDRKNKLYGVLGQDYATPDARENALVKAGFSDEALKFGKDRRDNAKTDAETQAKTIETAHKRLEVVGQGLGWLKDNPSMENAQALIQNWVQGGIMSQADAQQKMAQFQADPTSQGIQRLALMGYQGAITATAQLPKLETRNTGSTTDTLKINPITGKVDVVSSVQNTQSPDSIASNATARANNRDTIAKDLQVAGMTPGGGVDENSERTAQAIASGQLPAPTGMALLNPKNQRILGRVMEINPQYDSTTVEAKKKAARDFSSGSQGNSMRSFAVAGQHLDQLGTLVDALDNGNMQLVNKIGNTISQQTGSPAVTNFDAAKDVVSKEVVKAIVAGGGGVEERRELAQLMDAAKSPAQLKGVIKQYRNLMSAQHDALLQQRDAAGLPRSTLPKYTDAGGSPEASSVPNDIAAILQKHGGK